MPAAPAYSKKIIGLTGFMGCGKSTVGRLLAARLGWRFVDLDPSIEEHASLTINEIFERLGEPVFREMEHAVLARVLGEALERNQATVIALGGGTFAQPAAAALLRESGCAVVWLRCPLETLLARCATMTNRPLFRDEATFLDLYRRRLPFYQQAPYCVESNREPLMVVEHLLAQGIVERVTV
ncbi:MAG: shikimate kinase [Candidatus Acidiferrales bacterium]